MTKNVRWRAFLWVHLGVLLAAVLFFCYALVVGRFLPERFFHCLMHDVFRLYCPLCGGTRAVRALVSFRIMDAVYLCPTVLCLVPLLLILDVRAFFLLCRGSNRALFPRPAISLMLALLLAGTVLRNVLMLYGYDPAGELAAFWAGRLSATARLAGSLLLVLSGGALFAAVYEGKRSLSSRGRFLALLLAAALAVGVLTVLSSRLILLLLLLPIFGVAGFCIARQVRAKSGEVPHTGE